MRALHDHQPLTAATTRPQLQVQPVRCHAQQRKAPFVIRSSLHSCVRNTWRFRRSQHPHRSHTLGPRETYQRHGGTERAVPISWTREEDDIPP